MRRLIKILQVLFLMAVFFSCPVYVLAEDLEAKLEKIVKGFESQLDENHKGEAYFLVVHSFFNKVSKKPTELTLKAETYIVKRILDSSLGRINGAIFHWKSNTMPEKTVSGEGATYQRGVWEKKLVESYGKGFLITGTTTSLGGRIEIQADLVDMATGKVLKNVIETINTGTDGVLAATEQAAQEAEEHPKKITAELPKKGSLYITTEPKDAEVKILNSNDRFHPGMEIDAGRYQVAVQAEGFEKQTQWVTITAGEPFNVAINLKPAKHLNGLEYKVIKGANARYEGYTKVGKRHGQGTLFYNSGDRYAGQWKDDKKYGQGTYSFNDGDKYVGQWKDDKMQGQGTYLFKSGAKYTGEWQNDTKHGKGTYYNKNGDKWEGSYINNKKHGKGVLTWTNGESKEEFWDNNKLVR